MKRYLLIAACLFAGNVHTMQENQKNPDDLRIDIPGPSETKRKEQKLFERMAAMRQEQAHRERQGSNHDGVKIKTTETVYSDGTKTGSISCDFGEEGIPVDEFIDALQQTANENASKKKDFKTIGFASSLTDKKWADSMKNDGYTQVGGEGSGAFAQPGHEQKVVALIALMNHLMEESEKEKTN